MQKKAFKRALTKAQCCISSGKIRRLGQMHQLDANQCKLKLPPGQLEVLGDGVGITLGIGTGGVWLGVGVPSVVEPIGPNLMSDCDGDVGVAFDGVHRCSIILPSWV